MDAIEIQELREAGEDGGGLMGYFCRGHVNAAAFAEACNAYTKASCEDDKRFVAWRQVRHVWWRTVPMSGQDGCMQYLPADPRSRGAWKATVAEPQEEWHAKRRKLFDAHYRRGQRYGFQRALEWVLWQLEFGSQTAVTMPHRRAIADELRRSFSADELEQQADSEATRHVA